jgi:RHH-type transcriptional regulator, proline utilization regulon repressor / proline dehydrogenase / delta 1-pyrroline-5-carboxylate dehydrogenase
VGKQHTAARALEAGQKLLAGVSGRALSRAETAAKALELAEHLFALAQASVDPTERARRRRLARLLDDPPGQLLSVLLTDRVARDKSLAHAVPQLEYLMGRLGVPRFLSSFERLELSLGARLGAFAPRFAGKQIAAHIRSEVKGLVLPLEERALASFLEQRRAEGLSVNVNQLGEEVLGEQRAAQRLEEYIQLLSRPDVDTISVKLSSIFSQVDLFAWDTSRESISERLRQIYRAALSSVANPPDLAPDSSSRPAATRSKLVYLDMEAYRDLRFTVSLFQRLLDEAEFQQLSAGLVLQAYIPDSAVLQRELTSWAVDRRRRGGAPLRLRVVKGANLAAERVQSSRMGWALPIYPSKAEVDANYKRMLYVGTEPAHADALHLGIASHNIFDLALGLVLRASRSVGHSVGFEVLEGMAGSVQRALVALGAPVLVYAPVVSQHELDTAVAYLLRRLDENTSHENFLRHSFSMQPGDTEYAAQARRFLDAHQAVETVSSAPRRSRDRFGEVVDLGPHEAFRNEPDTDFAEAAHRSAVLSALDQARTRPSFEICSVIAGAPAETGEIEYGFDPSRPRVVPYRCQLARAEEVESALRSAERALGSFGLTSLSERVEWVRGVARVLRRRRAGLIAVMLLDAGKRASEADAEVSEAIDFAEYYLRQAEELGRDARVVARPKGVVVVTSPWNFPLAIPLSGVLAGLLAGDPVILKPSLETALTGEQLCAAVWDAGVPKTALQLVLCRDEVGTLLLRHPAVRGVVLTGATSTARFFLEQRPALDLCAETGGKNALIVTALADRELAIRDLVASTFGFSGQKCSAASLAILEAEVYDDRHFRAQLRDAAASLVVGSAWEPASSVTPLIRPPEPALRRGLTQLETGESWLLEPSQHPDNPRLWSPGIKLGVSAGSFTHQTELFGPVLGVLRARDLSHALELANATPYGLVGGLHSLDERQQEQFLAQMACGNLYVNRTITGAIVGRQPFGGHKASSVGPGAKAGGPNYVVQLVELAEPDAVALPPRAAPPAGAPALAALAEWAREQLAADELACFAARVEDYACWLQEYFHRDHPASAVLGQDNLLRYLPCRSLLLVATAESTRLSLASASAAALLSGNGWQLSLCSEGSNGAAASPRLERDFQALAAACGCAGRVEAPSALAARLAGVERLRWLGAPEREPHELVLRAAGKAGCHVSTRAVLGHGRYELLWNHREQAISVEYHRYGHLGWRSEGIAQSVDVKMNSKATFSPSGPAARGP